MREPMGDEAAIARPDEAAIARAAVAPAQVLVVRRGPGANCSSVGSVLDVLFVSATVGGAVLVAVAALLGEARAKRDAEKTGGAPRAGEG